MNDNLKKSVYTLKLRQQGMSTIMYNQLLQSPTSIVIDDFDDTDFVDAPSKKDIWFDLEERLINVK